MSSGRIQDIAEKVVSGRSSAKANTVAALRALAQNHSYNLVINTCKKRALERAEQIDRSLKTRGENFRPGRLAGVPFVAKDNFLSFGPPTTAASKMLQNFVAPYQSTAIEKLEAEGAVCVAKVNLDAFAHGSSTENSDFGPTLNPRDPGRVPGGSSGGSAAAVALDCVPFALGTDTGGSVRLPASFCGVVGFKPTYGLISRYGVVAMASSTDVVGTLSRSAADAALLIDVLAGRDPNDPTTLPRPKDLADPVKSSPLKIGLIKEFMGADVESGVREAVDQTCRKLARLGHVVEPVSLPSLPLALAVYYIVVPAEISSNLARYDGIRYGYSSPDANSLAEVYGLSRDQAFNTENKRRILIGTYVLSSGYIEAYYQKAQTVRTKLINDFKQAFNRLDFLIGPVAPTTAFRLGENVKDPLKMYLTDIMTVGASIAGLPAISLPSGTDDAGLPVGVQLIGPQLSDGRLLNLAKDLEGV